MRYSRIYISIISVILLAACASQKDIAYMQNSATVDLSKSQGLYDLRIIPQDVLNISVASQDLLDCRIFNKRTRTEADKQYLSEDEARSVASSSTAGLHQGSKWRTISAPVRLSPVPPALREIRNTGV